MEGTHDNWYVNAILIVLCMSNGLICAYITGIHDKRMSHHAHDICCKQLEFSASILSVNYFVTIYAADNL